MPYLGRDRRGPRDRSAPGFIQAVLGIVSRVSCPLALE